MGDKVEIRDFALQISQQINTQDPFATLPENEASFLNAIKIALDNKSTETGNASLMQLSVELQSAEKQMMKEKRKSNIATMLTIVGLILTVLFGILSFMK